MVTLKFGDKDRSGRGGRTRIYEKPIDFELTAEEKAELGIITNRNDMKRYCYRWPSSDNWMVFQNVHRR